MKELFTTGDLAKRYGSDINQINYIVRRDAIEPIGRVAGAKVYDEAAAERIGEAVDQIARRKTELETAEALGIDTGEPRDEGISEDTRAKLIAFSMVMGRPVNDIVEAALAEFLDLAIEDLAPDKKHEVLERWAKLS